MKNLDKAFEKYFKEVQQIANTEFNRVIRPYLDKHNYYFVSGNGTYYIESIDTGAQIDPEKLPKRIYNILDAEIEGMPANPLGSLMPDYTPEKRIK